MVRPPGRETRTSHPAEPRSRGPAERRARRSVVAPAPCRAAAADGQGERGARPPTRRRARSPEAGAPVMAASGEPPGRRRSTGASAAPRTRHGRSCRPRATRRVAALGPFRQAARCPRAPGSAPAAGAGRGPTAAANRGSMRRSRSHGRTARPYGRGYPGGRHHYLAVCEVSLHVKTTACCVNAAHHRGGSASVDCGAEGRQGDWAGKPFAGGEPTVICVYRRPG